MKHVMVIMLVLIFLTGCQIKPEKYIHIENEKFVEYLSLKNHSHNLLFNITNNNVNLDANCSIITNNEIYRLGTLEKSSIRQHNLSVVFEEGNVSKVFELKCEWI